MSKKNTAAQQQQQQENQNRLPTHNVYVIEGEGENAFWTKVGAVWSHSDGEGFNIALTAVPLTGRLVVRTRKEKQKEGGE